MLNKKNRVFIFLFSIIFLFSFTSMAMARLSYQPQIKPLESCLACHENKGGGGEMNDFGNDWLKNGKKFENIKNLDSDGDGVTNAQEIQDETLPGDPSSNRNAKPPYLLIALGVIAVGLVGGYSFRMVLRIREINTAKQKEQQEEK